MNNYDIILHFEWVHCSHIHKYLALNRRLNKFCNCLLIFDDGKFGVTLEQKNMFKQEYFDKVIICSSKKTSELLSKFKYSVYVTGNAGSKTNRYWIDIANEKAITVVISDFMGDAGYYRSSDIYSLINSIMLKTIKHKPKNIWFSNCLLWDNIDECLPYYLSAKEFCDKYSLDFNDDILLWMPDSIQCQKGQAAIVYEMVCRQKNVIIKLHPNEYKRYKSEKVNGKWSYELYSSTKKPVLDPIDTHWAYKYASCGFSHTSSVGLEFPMYKKPFVYVDHPSLNKSPTISFKDWQKINNDDFGGEFSWVGYSCDSDKLNHFIEAKEYKIYDDNLYNVHMKKFLAFPDRKAIDVLSEQLIGLISQIKK